MMIDSFTDFDRALTEPLDNVRGYILIQNDKVVHEHYFPPYKAENKSHIWSCSKTFTATAVGICEDMRLLTVDDSVLDYFPEQKISACYNLRQLKIHHLLSMSTGQKIDPVGFDFFGKPFDLLPGSHFMYNSAASHMLSLIVQKITGQKLEDFLQSKLFEPLNFGDLYWRQDSNGATTGGWGLHLCLRDLAKLGQLYLNGGEYNGKRIVSREWIKKATRKHSRSNEFDPRPDWSQGYGYQLWRGQHNTYRADGRFGQYCIVIPDVNAVFALQSDSVEDMQAILNCVWEFILPQLSDH